MTPQEKAKELVDKFDELLTYRESKTKTKECAILAVNEIRTMANKNKIVYSDYNGNCLEQYTEDYYWLKVKQEINKIC